MYHMPNFYNLRHPGSMRELIQTSKRYVWGILGVYFVGTVASVLWNSGQSNLQIH